MEEAHFELSSPTDTPHRTPSSSRSRHSRPYDSMSPASSSPPPLPSDDRPAKRRSNGSVDPATDENISPLDPRRFTPTLHASLVSEILSLRRDLELKTKDIDQLEHSLHSAKTENETLSATLATTGKEARSLKRQMQLLEGGTLNALNEIAQERDVAQNDLNDLRKRFEQAQRKARSHEENVERTQTLWDQDKERWNSERRGLETKVHIVEGRLKVVLSEVVNSQTLNGNVKNGDHVDEYREVNNGSPVRRSTNSALSHRCQSAASNSSDHLGGRVSALGHFNGLSTSLADELGVDEEDENELHELANGDGRCSPDALPEEFERPMSSLSIKARKILGLPMELEDVYRETPSPRKSALLTSHPNLSTVRESVARFERYVDSSAQYSPPPSPKAVVAKEAAEAVPSNLPLSTVTTQSSQEWGPNGPVSPVSTADSTDSHWTGHQIVQKSVMVSTSCQTTEALRVSPEPGLTREDSTKTITRLEAPTKAQLQTTGTQTEPPFEIPEASVKKDAYLNVISQLSIPTIAIIPPGSRPATPETNVVLPPRTKNASCQVSMQSLAKYNSAGIQTDDTKTLDTSSTYHAPPSLSTSKGGTAGKAAPPNSSRRRFQPTPPPTIPATSLPRKEVKQQADEDFSHQNNDTGPLVRDFGSNLARPVRSSSLFAGFDDETDNFDEDEFEHEDIFSQPTAKYVLKSGKLVREEPVLEDIGEASAAEAGEAVAMEKLRRSEDGLPPEVRNNLPSRRGSPKKFGQKSLKRVGSAKQPPNYRRAVLISSGAAAHQSLQSPRGSAETTRGPPVPVPVRFSSAKVGKSWSEGGRSSRASSAQSPTRKEKPKSKKHTLRKARSGPAISPGPNGRRSGSRSPPLDTRVSIVPDMPSFQLPVPSSIPFLSDAYHDASVSSAPRPSIATGPHRKTAHVRSQSEAVSIQQTSVVDSIAQTMVGEWMYKYVRRRKSFGITDAKVNDWDPNKPVDELSANVASTGVRHKRWVWLAPYERAVMWSSKQPTSNNALLGKSGRKLTVQSVLDVKDDNPMPKNSISGHHFNRSILILTPQRALKFTATTQERHYIWLTALSFLSHSPLSLVDLQALPSPPQNEHYEVPPAQFAGSLRRRPIRDSIRIAKTSGRAGQRSFTTDGSLPPQVSSQVEARDYYDMNSDAALPPTVPRFSSHTRKRSNTAPRAPPSAFRAFPTRDGPPSIPMPGGSSYSGISNTAASSDHGVYTPSIGFSSRRGSEASAMSNRPAQGIGAYYDNGNYNISGNTMSGQHRSGTMTNGQGGGNPTGTMRMDAFIQGKVQPRGGPNTTRRQHTGRGKDLSYWGMGDGGSSNRDSMSPIDANNPPLGGNSGSTSATSHRNEDPFRGF